MRNATDQASKLPLVVSSNCLPQVHSRAHRAAINQLRLVTLDMTKQEHDSTWETYHALNWPASYMYAVSVIELAAVHAAKRAPVNPSKSPTQYDYSKTVYKSQAERRALHTDYVKAVINELPTDAIEYVSHTIDMLLLMPTISKPEYMAHEVTL